MYLLLAVVWIGPFLTHRLYFLHGSVSPLVALGSWLYVGSTSDFLARSSPWWFDVLAWHTWRWWGSSLSLFCISQNESAVWRDEQSVCLNEKAIQIALVLWWLCPAVMVNLVVEVFFLWTGSKLTVFYYYYYYFYYANIVIIFSLSCTLICLWKIIILLLWIIDRL